MGHLAWVEGFLFDEEVDYLSEMLTQLQVPTADQRRVLASKPELPSALSLRVTFADEESRRQLLGAAYRLSHIDNDPGPEEWAVVAQICQALELPLGDWGQLRDYVESNKA